MTHPADTALYPAWLVHEPSGNWLALAADLAGCYATGASQGEALERLAEAIPTYYTWLSQHDDYTPTLRSQARVEAVESHEMKPGGASAYFAADAEPVNDEDLDWLLAVLGWAYDDLLAVAERRSASPALEAALSRVAAVQVGLIAYATGAIAPNLPMGGAARVKAARDMALSMFRMTSARQREVTHEETGQRWSLRRGLRESALVARRAADDLARL
jgi:predicted RNase H-like HicB family nuclease